MRVLIYNQKGGVGKTTTAVNLGAGLLRSGAGSVLLADLDPQMHLTAGLGFLANSYEWTTTEWLAGVEGETFECASEPGLHLVPGNSERIAADAEISELPNPNGADWVIMDAPPSWEPWIGDLMHKVDVVLCPLEPDFLGLQGLNRLLRSMREAKIEWSKLRLLLTRFDSRLSVHREVRARLDERFGEGMVLPATIRRSVRLAEAPGQGLSIFGHAPGTTVAQDYLDLADTLTGHELSLRAQG